MEYKKYKLSECCTIIAGQSPESKYYNTDGEGLPFFQGKADFGEVYPKIRVFCSKPVKIAEKDDILLSVRAPVGPTNLAPGKVCIGRGLTAIRPSDILLTKYLLLYLKSFEIELANQGTGTTFKAITQSVIKNMEIYIPSIHDQERIVTQIEESLSQLDSAVETLKKTKQQLEVYRQSVLREVFSQCEQSVEIKTVCKHVTDGDHMPPPKAETGIPFIMISNINGNTIDWSDTSFVGKEYYNTIGDKRTPQKGDVLYTVTGSFGIPVLIDFEKEFCFQRHIALLRPNEKIEQEFLYYALQDSTVYAQASKRATGTAQKTVGLTVLRTISIPFTTSKEKQSMMVSIIKNRLSQCDMVEKTVNQSLQQAKALRQSILKQAFEEER